MSDLGSGRYPFTEEEWLLDGSPTPPYRRTINRRDICSSSLALTSAKLFVYAVPVQAGDLFDFVSFVATAGTTPTHSWVALYNGTGATATLQAQSADVTTGFTTGANKLQLQSVVGDVPTVGTPQGPNTGPIVASGPAIWGVAVYNSATTGATIDGMIGGSLLGEVALAGQAPLSSQLSLAATATAPANLTGIAAIAAGVPYIVLSRN